ncbi:hypothetical protein KIN20_019984 [Parelaphostrongylus tenuis]|uniref:Adenylate kinase n=1 Tax=Parelaphostrongylus tenuis TaxID=148309 RepID=A0AAD5N9B9_PARTN|nr:hypothetical protein KIN20_019984 [Parelaphostrongylus tenuis]
MLMAVAEASKGFLIDGYPRELKQGEQFELEIGLAKSVTFLDVSDEILNATDSRENQVTLLLFRAKLVRKHA